MQLASPRGGRNGWIGKLFFESGTEMVQPYRVETNVEEKSTPEKTLQQQMGVTNPIQTKAGLSCAMAVMDEIGGRHEESERVEGGEGAFEDDIISDRTELSGFCVDQQCEVVCVGFSIAFIVVAHCCSMLSLSPIKDWLQQNGEGRDGRHVQVYRNDTKKLEHLSIL